MRDLIRAAERGKQVVVLVEIKARFDEEANIVWARKLEQAGAHVVYGLVGLKTHSKTALVVRREGSGLRRYVHIGTGNYNPKTARLYVDLGLLTCRPELGADVTDLFNVLTGLSRQRAFRRLLVAPHTLRSRVLELIDREIGHAKAGRRGADRVQAQRDRRPGLHRGAVPGEPGRRRRGPHRPRHLLGLAGAARAISERIHVRSIVGEFLEHSRIFGFVNGGDQEWYIGSADLMERNLDRRVEAVVPVEDAEARDRIAEIVAIMLADDRRSWQLGSDARWRRIEEINGAPGTLDTFETLKERGARVGRAAWPMRRAARARGRVRSTRGPDGDRPSARHAGRGRAQVPRCLDLATGERFLAADALGPFRAVSAARAAAARGSLPRHVRRRARPGRLRRAPAADPEAGRSSPSSRTTSSDGSLARREELEGPADRTAEPHDWPASAARSLILELCGDAPLVELVTVRQLRRKRRLKATTRPSS